MQLLPIYIFMSCYPLGIAAQTLGAGIGVLVLLFRQSRKQVKGLFAEPQTSLPMWISLAYLLWGLMSDLLNPAVSLQWRSPFGYIPWLLIPWLVAKQEPQLTARDLRRLANALVFLTAFWAMVVLSQYVIGWRISGIEIVSDLKRPRGFYSHPLTLAYAVLWLVPLAILWPLHSPKCRRAWLFLLSVSVVVMTTNSRTVVAVMALVVVWNIVMTKTRWRPLLVVGCLIGMVALGTTENRLSQRFGNMLTEQGEDRMSDYPDDRLAFWHAYWEMIKERPIVGHGGPMNTEYRLPYYSKIGLAGFERPYEAHNAYIQILGKHGIIGLLIFMAWLGWLWLVILRHPKGFARKVMIQSYLAFLLACLTQNAFQDSEVRMGLTMFAAAVYGFSWRPEEVRPLY